LPAQMPVGQLKIWPINIKWHFAVADQYWNIQPAKVYYICSICLKFLSRDVSQIDSDRGKANRLPKLSAVSERWRPTFSTLSQSNRHAIFCQAFLECFFFFSGPENVNVCKCERLLNTASISEWKEKESGSRASRRPPTQKHSKQNENYTNGKKVWNYFKSERNIIWSNRTRNVFRCFGSYINGPWL
jgi:hypothetical protein